MQDEPGRPPLHEQAAEFQSLWQRQCFAATFTLHQLTTMPMLPPLALPALLEERAAAIRALIELREHFHDWPPLSGEPQAARGASQRPRRAPAAHGSG